MLVISKVTKYMLKKYRSFTPPIQQVQFQDDTLVTA
jgi:hypothetical protein